ncbi:MAG: hypothetical protein ACOCVU_02120 [Desulfohalobiaceae bacterium]
MAALLIAFPFRYLRATPLPHAFALLCMAICTLLLWLWLRHDGHSLELKRLFLPALSLWAGAAGLISLADAFSRFREYRRLVRIFKRYGYKDRVLVPAASSRCQRDAAIAAAVAVGCGGRARSYYRSLGYRWYHLLPDPVMRNPLLFLSPSFLIEATFSRRLRPCTRDT